jgi:lactoylglutathione lyase
MVSDLESTARTLNGKHAIIEDPDGHLISITEMKSKAADEFDLLGLLGAE